MIRTAVVILNWNGLDYLKEFLPTVIKFSAGNDCAVYIADNASTDSSTEWIEENHPEVKLIKLDKNNGFAGGYNRALKLIDARYYVLLNSDVEVTEGWLAPLVNYMETNTRAAACQPKILSFNNTEQFEYAGAAGGFIDKYGYPFCRGRIFDTIETDTGQYDSAIESFWSSGACMIVRSTLWRKCGGLDELFFAHMEEIDLCWRFARAGFKVGFVPDSVVYHVGGGTLPYDSPFKTFLNFRNNLFLLYKNLPEKGFRSTLFKRKIMDGAAAVMFLLKGRPKSFFAVFRAHMDYYKNSEKLKFKREEAKKLDTGCSINTILNKSIVFEFYVRRNKTYNSLIKEK